jgi:hypothetical protein
MSQPYMRAAPTAAATELGLSELSQVNTKRAHEIRERLGNVRAALGGAVPEAGTATVGSPREGVVGEVERTGCLLDECAALLNIIERFIGAPPQMPR